MPVSISLEHAPDHILGALRHVPPVCGRKVIVALLDLAKERRLGVRLECGGKKGSVSVKRGLVKQYAPGSKYAASEHNVQNHTHSGIFLNDNSYIYIYIYNIYIYIYIYIYVITYNNSSMYINVIAYKTQPIVE